MTIVPLQPLPLPELASPGALDKLLHDRVAVRDLPAIFLAATNADETIYLNQAGERVFGDASKGEVNEDTRGYRGCSDASVRAVLTDEVGDKCGCFVDTLTPGRRFTAGRTRVT